MKVKRFIGGSLDTNGYVIYKEDEGSCYFIDCGYKTDEYVDFVQEHKLKPSGIIFTHHHYDHVSEAYKLADKFHIKMFVHNQDEAMLKKFFHDKSQLVEGFGDDREFELDGDVLTVVNTPGHTKGGIFLINKSANIAFSGDTVFKDEIGITNLEDGSDKEMAGSCQEFIAKLPRDMVIYPGHGDEATIEYVIKNNEEFKVALNMAVDK